MRGKATGVEKAEDTNQSSLLRSPRKTEGGSRAVAIPKTLPKVEDPRALNDG
jgi:hypothetical protein